MNLRAHLEELAVDTWERLRDARALGIRFGEETITDLVLLEMKRKHSARSYIAQTPLHKEKTQGTDWEWWIGSDRVGWIRYAVQAKRLNKDLRYGSITHKVNGTKQIDLLERYAKKHRALPLYCLYNYSGIGIDNSAWNCSLPYKKYQLACTITSIGVARHAIDNWGEKTFAKIHANQNTLPWRCLIACPRIKRIYRSARLFGFSNDIHPVTGTSVNVYPELPVELRNVRETGRVDFDQTASDFYSPDFDLPKRILVLETDETDEDGA